MAAVTAPLPPALLVGALLLLLTSTAGGQAVFSSSAVCYTKSFSFGVCVAPGQCQVHGDGSSRCSADQVCCKRDQVQLETTTTTTTTPAPPVHHLVADCGLAHPNTFLLRSRRRRALTSPAEFGLRQTDPHVTLDTAEGPDEGDYHGDIIDLLVAGGTDAPPSERAESPAAAGRMAQADRHSSTSSSVDKHTNAHGGFEHSDGYAMMKHSNGNINGHTNGHTDMDHTSGLSGAGDTDGDQSTDGDATTLRTSTATDSAGDLIESVPATDSFHVSLDSASQTLGNDTESARSESQTAGEASSFAGGAEKSSRVETLGRVTDTEEIEKHTIETTTDTSSLENESSFSSADRGNAEQSSESATDSTLATYTTEPPLTSTAPITTTTTTTTTTTSTTTATTTITTTSTTEAEPFRLSDRYTTTPSAAPSERPPDGASTSAVPSPAEDTVGERATVGRWPWIALLGEADRWFCTGTLIAPSTVLTAARCVVDRPAAGITVRLGEYDLSKTGDGRLTEVNVASVTVHAEYRASQHDLALLRLARPVAFSTRVRPACLPAAGADLTGAEADLAGWRQLRRRSTGRQPLAQVRLHVMDEDECEQTYRGSSEFDTSFPGGFGGGVLCANGRDGSSRDSCQGDAGGPLVVRELSGRYQVVGVSASGLGCHIPRYPAVYTKVSEHIPWIVANSE